MPKHRSLLPLFGALLFLVSSCSSTGPITIIDKPASTIEGIAVSSDKKDQVRFLRYGELDQIRSLDPLFALNPAAQRVVQLIHEGLTGFDENGAVVPRLAQKWDVSSDSLTWVFTLRDDAFFQDAIVFTSGIGRKVTASDVYNSFKRMGSTGVPPNAARMFVDYVAGFDAYFREQHEIYFEQDRVISEIVGIRVIDDQTIQFNLSEPDPSFLQKLASPLAAIYPLEAYANKQSAEQGIPVGTGPFRFERALGDSLYVLRKNHRYWGGAETILIDQIEIVKESSETELFKKFARNDLDFIAELGPQMMRSLIDENGKLEASYTQNFKLYEGASQRYEFYYNPLNAYQFSLLDTKFLFKNFTSAQYSAQMSAPVVQIMSAMETFPPDFISQKLAQFDTSRSVINVSFNGNFVAGDFLLQLTQSTKEIAPMRIYRSPLITREILAYVVQSSDSPNGVDVSLGKVQDRLVEFEVKRYAIINTTVDGIKMNRFAWWLDFRGAKITPKES